MNVEHRYFTYIVCSSSGTLYIGMTNNIYRRALEHKQGKVEGSASKYHCERLVHYEGFQDVQKASRGMKRLAQRSEEPPLSLAQAPYRSHTRRCLTRLRKFSFAPILGIARVITIFSSNP